MLAITSALWGNLLAKSRRRNKRVLIGLAVGLLALLAFGTAGYALFQGRTPPAASAKILEAANAGATLAPKPDQPLAVFLGDSYTQGKGATSAEGRWVGLVATTQKWDYVNLGRGGTGYLATSTAAGCGLDFCPNIEGMIPLAASESPDIIVVAGGQNDFSAFNTDRAAVMDSIGKTYAALRAKFPEAQLVAVGPSTPWGVNKDVILFDEMVQDAASKVQAKYVSLIEPDVIDPTMLLEDKAHVNDAGHKAIAERVIAALR